MRPGRGAPAGDWTGMVVVCAGTSWDGIWFPEKHIAHRLAEWAPVLWVDPPISRLTGRRSPQAAAAMGQPRLRLVRPGLARLSPVALPGMHRRGMYTVTEALVRRAIRGAVQALGGSVRALVVATQSDVFGACRDGRSVLYATDDFAAGAGLMGVPEARVRRLEARQAAKADAVVAASEELRVKWRRLGHEPLLVANGCDDELFATTDQAPVPSDISLPPPVAGFIGHLSDRIDLALLEAVAGRDRSLLLVGPRQPTFELARMDALLARPNVRWVGAKPFEQLPSYVRPMRVGLTPYADTAFNRASFPLKTLEYLAAGRAVVATDLPAVRWLGTDLIASTPPSDPEAFADAVDAALDDDRAAELASRRQAFAARHSWSARAREFASLLGITVPEGAPSTTEESWI